MFASSTTPVEAPALSGASEILRSSAGGCALLSGRIWCWGRTLLLGKGDDSEARQLPITLTCDR